MVQWMARQVPWCAAQHSVTGKKLSTISQEKRKEKCSCLAHVARDGPSNSPTAWSDLYQRGYTMCSSESFLIRKKIDRKCFHKILSRSILTINSNPILTAGRYRSMTVSIHFLILILQLNFNQTEWMGSHDKLHLWTELTRPLPATVAWQQSSVDKRSERWNNESFSTSIFLWFIGTVLPRANKNEIFRSSDLCLFSPKWRSSVLEENTEPWLSSALCKLRFSHRPFLFCWNNFEQRVTLTPATSRSQSCLREVRCRWLLSRWSIKRRDHVCFVRSTWTTAWFSGFVCILALTGWP